MSEVSSWSNTDAGNNLTPPDGWPEGMQPSGVNDVGRMMMGAIKRWYDTVTTGIANCLPLSGGTLTGPLVVPGLTSTGNITASGDISANAVNAVSLHASGSISADGQVSGNSVTGNYIHSAGNLDTVSLHATGSISADGQVSGNSVTGNYMHAAGNLDVDAALTAGSLWSNSTISANSSVSAASANITNSIACNLIVANAYVDAPTIRVSGNNLAVHRTDGQGTCNAIYDGGGGVGIDLYGPNGSFYRCDNAHWFTNRAATLNVAAFVTTTGGAAAGTCLNASGTWSTLSDGSIKEGVKPYRAGLAAALRLNPCSFRYIPGKSPFAVEGQTYYGLVAQEVEPVLPEMVGLADDGLATLAPGHLIFVLLNAVKELEARLAQVENRGG